MILKDLLSNFKRRVIKTCISLEPILHLVSKILLFCRTYFLNRKFINLCVFVNWKGNFVFAHWMLPFKDVCSGVEFIFLSFEVHSLFFFSLFEFLKLNKDHNILVQAFSNFLSHLLPFYIIKHNILKKFMIIIRSIRYLQSVYKIDFKIFEKDGS